MNKTNSGHAVKLRLNAFLAPGNRDWVVEYSICGVVAVCLFCGLELVVAEDVLDHLVFLFRRLSCGKSAFVGFCSARHGL